jgi:uncharacterized protein (TIGR02246 family)
MYAMHDTGYMQRAKRMVAFSYILMAIAAYGQTPQSGSDESAIRKLVAAYMDARNTRNARATSELFTDDADQLVSTGEWRKGIEDLVRGAMASSKNEASKSSIELESIRFIDSAVALADGRYETVSATTGARRNMWTSLVLKRTSSGWRISAIRNMLPAPPAPQSTH